MASIAKISKITTCIFLSCEFNPTFVGIEYLAEATEDVVDIYDDDEEEDEHPEGEIHDLQFFS